MSALDKAQPLQRELVYGCYSSFVAEIPTRTWNSFNLRLLITRITATRTESSGFRYISMRKTRYLGESFATRLGNAVNLQQSLIRSKSRK